MLNIVQENVRQVVKIFYNMMTKIKDNLISRGRFRITTYKAGTKEIIKQSDWIKNLVVLNATGNGHGMNLLVKRLIGNTTTDLVITQAKIGTGDTAPTDNDTDLETAVLSGIIVADTIETSADVATISFFMTDAELTDGEYKEFGIFCGTQLFARALILPTYTKATGQDTSVEYEITVTN